jgi:DNA topoisomerase-2
MSKTIESKYRKLTDVEHVLLRPGMYVGSTKAHESDYYLIGEENKFHLSKVSYNPGFLKIFDEIVSNSVDEHKRNSKLNQIKITIDRQNGRISIWDNGGIPVQKHKEYGEWIPELIFSNLKTGSNFDDSEDRTVAGTNGVGATLTNIFSKEFKISTCDGSKEYVQVFSENMHKRTDPKISTGKKGYTEVSYLPDFSRFSGLDGIDDVTYEMMRKRACDIAACNPRLKVTFNGENFLFKSFNEYCELYIDEVHYEESKHWKIAVGHSTAGFQSVSFVNSVETKDGGTHVEYIFYQVSNWLREKIRKKYKVDVKPSELRNHMFIFIEATVVNSSFSSQTKEKLITEYKDFGSEHVVSENLMKRIFTSEVVKSVLDWIEQKQLAEERKQLRSLNKNLDKAKIIKLIDAKSKDNRDKCTLSVFEGDSASSAFRQYRNPQYQGAFPLRGKFINVMEVPNTKIIQNNEVKNLLASIGLKLGEPPKDLRYGKIMIYTDQDHDGMSIAGLLMNFFAKFWPELFEQGRICKVETPLMVAKKDKQTHSFYTMEEYQKWESSQKNLNGWSIEYKKGLASLEDVEYEEIIRNPRYFKLEKGAGFKESFDTWFAGDSFPRKLKILGQSAEEYTEVNETKSSESTKEKTRTPKVEKIEVEKVKVEIKEVKKEKRDSKLF